MKKEPRKIAINAKENWGGLIEPDTHTAAFGARIADNRRRELEFGLFSDRMTLVGEEKVARKLEKLVLGRKVLKDIKRNTSFAFSGDDRNCWGTTYSLGKDIDVALSVECSGEYVYVKAYADRAPSCALDVVPIEDKFGEVAWLATMEGRSGEFPVIHAATKTGAMNILMDFVANELEARDDLWTI